MSFLYTVDPGVKGSALAEWQIDTQIFKIERLVDVWVNQQPSELEGRLLIELPQVYQGRKQKGDPNDLIDLAVVVGRWTERAHGVVDYVRPREWKGQVPKEIMTKRIISKLTLQELSVLGALKKNHNVVDAVGIGLWKLGRL